MSFNLTGGNPRAHRIRVYLFGTTVVLEGMPVCYDNSTTNWHGGSMTLGVVTESTTTAEGSQNEGKYIRVEIPNADNCSLFAGVVAKGSPGIGKAGPSAIDIYVPNGAVVPVLTDQNCLIDQTILAINSGEEELGVPLRGDSRSVAIARETIDRTTAGLVLAELCPDRFIHQEVGGTALSIDDSDTTADVVVNRIKVKSLQTGGQFTALHIQAESAAGASTINQRGLALKVEAIVSASVAQQIHGTTLALEITGGTVGEYASACQIKLYESGATISSMAGRLSVLNLCCQVAQTPPANNFGWIYMESHGAENPDFFLLANAQNQVPMAAQSSAVVSHVIPCRFGAQTFYIMVSDAA